ncbi:MAG: hypothetical protein MZW92_73490 [Comamonadaceae bacterium]|nr:hypothetical protein [Comamonadaceae bacterium]
MPPLPDLPGRRRLDRRPGTRRTRRRTGAARCGHRPTAPARRRRRADRRQHRRRSVAKLSGRGIRAALTTKTDPRLAVGRYLAGELAAPEAAPGGSGHARPAAATATPDGHRSARGRGVAAGPA